MLKNFITIWFAIIFTNLFLGPRFFFVRGESQHNTRQALNEVLHVPYTESTQTMKSITYSGTRVYNTVPVNIRRCGSLVAFKHRLRAHILSNNGG